MNLAEHFAQHLELEGYDNIRMTRLRVVNGIQEVLVEAERKVRDKYDTVQRWIRCGE